MRSLPFTKIVQSESFAKLSKDSQKQKQILHRNEYGAVQDDRDLFGGGD